MKHLKKRAEIIRAIRKFFEAESFTEVDTPALVLAPGMEPYLDAFQTKFQPENSHESAQLYLPTSPEFHMKRLLAQGL
jgi:elongation factor P--(R)-beta-lysine ligase